MRALAILLAIAANAWGQADVASRIRDAQQAGNYREAARLYGVLIAQGNDTPQMHANRGIMLQLAGENREALAELKGVLRANPGFAGANLFAGLAEFELGHPRAALPLLEKARKLSPENPAPLLALGKTCVALGDFATAHARYRQAAALAPQAPEAWFGAGVTARSMAERMTLAEHERQKYLAESLSDLTRAAKLDPNSARTHLLLADALRDAGRLVEAREEYTAALHIAPNMEAAYLGLATSLWKVNDFNQALPVLRKVLELDPRDPGANAMLADMLAQRGDYEGARRAAAIALAKEPGLTQALAAMARVHLAAGEPQPAIEELRKIISSDPSGDYHYLLFRAYKLAGDPQRAAAALEEFRRWRAQRRSAITGDARGGPNSHDNSARDSSAALPSKRGDTEASPNNPRAMPSGDPPDTNSRPPR